MSKRQSYWELLRDPRWQQKRLRIMERAKFQCEECTDKSTTLNVHHTYYEKGLAPWEYPDASLHCLCEPCHKKAEELRREVLRQIGLLDSTDCIAIIGAAKAMQMSGNKNVQHVFTSAIERWGMLKMFLGDQDTWTLYFTEVTDICKDLNPVSAHDVECAIQQADILMEIASGINFSFAGDQPEAAP